MLAFLAGFLVFFAAFPYEATATSDSLVPQQPNSVGTETQDPESEGLLGEGAVCMWTEECEKHLCCLNSGNGQASCQRRPNTVGANCSFPVFLTPGADEGTYQYVCPCDSGLTCNVTNSENAQSRSTPESEGEEEEKYGQCLSAETEEKPLPSSRRS
uniref:Putative secreted protein n=1 Tax=Amblyomma triste TaxID=251400 RepID=A0A023G515_AMBTT